ncbi:MAG TPA: fatty acid desaturase [Nannocystaceae bacterium]|nr:fatty acid desaturase [Nannocystaceae bacterium]
MLDTVIDCNTNDVMQQRPTRQPDLLHDKDRIAAFGRDIDAIRERIEAQVGADDLRRVRRLDALSRGCEIVGRTLLHFSIEPIGFITGTTVLWLHKQLQATEIGHTALHGAYDRIDGADRYHSDRFRWAVPIDEAAWRRSHNVGHHQYTNVLGRDPDLAYGAIRLSPRVEWQPRHRHQLWSVAYTWLGLGFFMNLHATGLDRALLGDNDPSAEEKLAASKEAGRKYVRYYLYEYVLFPVLAGGGWWKVFLGNWLAERMRDLYSAATIFCGHIGDDVHDYEAGTRPHSRAEWYAMQAASANDFRVPYVFSVLCGGLDYQIEHHLFPKLAPERLRQIAPEVQAACERHGVPYHCDTWLGTLKKAFARLRALRAPAVAA